MTHRLFRAHQPDLRDRIAMAFIAGWAANNDFSQGNPMTQQEITDTAHTSYLIADAFMLRRETTILDVTP